MKYRMSRNQDNTQNVVMRKNESVWSRDIENILDSIRQNSIVMNEEHKKRYIMLDGRLRYFRLPIIILSGVNSVVSVGFQQYIGQQTISAITCFLALGCGIISSVELYLALQKQMESELLACKDFYLLSTRIFAMISLDTENRKVDGMDFFEEVFSDYTNLMQKSIIIADKIEDRLIPIQDIVTVKLSKNRSVRNLEKRDLENQEEYDYEDNHEPFGINDVENNLEYNGIYKSETDESKTR